jgi:hypothetical protein
MTPRNCRVFRSRARFKKRARRQKATTTTTGLDISPPHEPPMPLRSQCTSMPARETTNAISTQRRDQRRPVANRAAHQMPFCDFSTHPPMLPPQARHALFVDTGSPAQVIGYPQALAYSNAFGGEIILQPFTSRFRFGNVVQQSSVVLLSFCRRPLQT